MICIIIPNYNGLKHLEVCFNSLRNQTYRDFETILVDNGSVDNSIKFISEKFPEVKLIPLDKNYGFAYATNAGIEKALTSNRFEFILFLNNDMECDKDFLGNLISGFMADEVGSTTSKIMNYYNRDIFDTTGDYYDFYSYPHKRGSDKKDLGQYDERGYVFGGCGGATMFRTEVFRKIGLLDNSFFAYYEDVDFNYRMQLAGYKCLYVPEAVCYHKCGATIKHTFSKKFYLMERNLTSLQVKNYHFKFFIKYGPVSVISRFWNYLRFVRRLKFNLFFYSLAGFFSGLFRSYQYLNKRKAIIKFRVATPEYIESISLDYKRGYKEFYKFKNMSNRRSL
jgi:GT2 family glycosyltransferase